MEFKKLKIDGVALMADLIAREADTRSPALAAALRRIDIVADGRYGKGRPDLRVTIAIAAGIEAAIDGPWSDRHASLSELVADVDAYVNVAERIYDERVDTIDMLKEVRSTLSREISKARRRGLPYRTLDVTLTPCATRSLDLPAVLIGVEVLGPLLDLERIVFDAEGAADVVRNFADMREKQEQRLAMRQYLSSVGADVMIDVVTLAALRDAGIDPAKAIADLRAEHTGIIDVDVRHGGMPFYVRDCVVIGNVPLGNGMRWNAGRLTIPQERGIRVGTAKGKALKRLVTHPLLNGDLPVDYATDAGKNICLHIRAETIPLSLLPLSEAA